ncbi:GNAT family N-acetyltransferase [Tenggerimyces flavus]|uniref:GNAT family N-acetyltransferase n=1 Tax=Tenggerimyces flavus TaxID=1708749 RepID=A0ABV7YF38_9ACTN|nr:GNAT family N-acetyltransferase [Tenggerimyces flavus]MBM7789202.1 GNAT superfamily N-acetyltransferase [Tenggerimyces flavus]
MELEFRGEVWEWRGPAPYYFVTVPDDACRALGAVAKDVSYGWGMIPVRAILSGSGGSKEWSTSLWPKDGGYVVPLKDLARKAIGVGAGDTVTLQLTTTKRDKPKRSPQPPPRPRPQVPRNRDRTPVTYEQLTIVPANQASWQDLEAIFESSGASSRCWCQRFKMTRGESWGSEGPDELSSRLKDQTNCGRPKAKSTTGLIAYLDGEPVGWCAVDPRSDNPRLASHVPVPWVGRNEDKTDPTVWAVTCFVVRAGYRRRGISTALARGAVDFARRRGARAVEGYPNLAEHGFQGSASAFEAAGFDEVSRPSKQRVVMRVDL